MFVRFSTIAGEWGAADHWKHREDEDYYSQPGRLFKLMSKERKKALFENTVRSISGASKDIQPRLISNSMKADPRYGNGVADALSIKS